MPCWFQRAMTARQRGGRHRLAPAGSPCRSAAGSAPASAKVMLAFQQAVASGGSSKGHEQQARRSAAGRGAAPWRSGSEIPPHDPPAATSGLPMSRICNQPAPWIDDRDGGVVQRSRLSRVGNHGDAEGCAATVAVFRQRVTAGPASQPGAAAGGIAAGRGLVPAGVSCAGSKLMLSSSSRPCARRFGEPGLDLREFAALHQAPADATGVDEVDQQPFAAQISQVELRAGLGFPACTAGTIGRCVAAPPGGARFRW